MVAVLCGVYRTSALKVVAVLCGVYRTSTLKVMAVFVVYIELVL